MLLANPLVMIQPLPGFDAMMRLCCTAHFMMTPRGLVLPLAVMLTKINMFVVRHTVFVVGGSRMMMNVNDGMTMVPIKIAIEEPY